MNLFGGIDARLEGGASLAFPTRKVFGLLAYLTVPPGKVHPRAALASLLWSDVGEDQARNSLRQCLFALRSAIAEAIPTCIVVNGSHVSINPADVVVDVVEFERLAAVDTPDAWLEATRLCNGEFLQGVLLQEPAFDQWADMERTRLRELAVATFTRLLDRQMAARAPELAVQTALRLLAVNPVQESVHRLLMTLYTNLGRPESALRQYSACAAVLRRELGVEPDRETQRLYRELVDRRPATPGGNGMTRPASILVVEDDEVTRTLLQGFLESAGYDVDVAEDGGIALTKLTEHPVDLVLADIDMPRLNGLKLLELVVRRGLSVPVVFLTALSGHEIEIQGFELGAADFIRKPIRKDLLVHRIENVLKRGTRYVAIDRDDEAEA